MKSSWDGVSEERLVPLILMASWLYYHRNVSLVEDEVFDEWCARLLAVRDIVDHPHLELISEEDLEAGTLYALKEEDYPSITKRAAARLYLDMKTTRRSALQAMMDPKLTHDLRSEQLEAQDLDSVAFALMMRRSR